MFRQVLQPIESQSRFKDLTGDCPDTLEQDSSVLGRVTCAAVTVDRKFKRTSAEARVCRCTRKVPESHYVTTKEPEASMFAPCEPSRQRGINSEFYYWGSNFSDKYGQLNGTHGTYTNTDDHGDNDERKRKHKEATTNRFRRPGQARSSNKRGNQANLPIVEPLSSLLPTVELDEKSMVNEHVEVMDFLGFLYMYDIDANKQFVNFEICVKEDYQIMPNPSFNVDIPTFFVHNIVYHKRNYTVYECLYKQLLMNFRHITPNERNMSAVNSFCVKFFMNLPRRAVEDVVVWFWYRNTSRGAYQDNTQLVKVSTDHSIVLSLDSLYKYPRIKSPNPEYEYNCQWRVVDKHGFKFDILLDDEGLTKIEPQNVSFDTHETPSDYRPTKIFYCLFLGKQTFAHYANCGVNVTAALSRYLKARSVSIECDEHIYKFSHSQLVENQLQVLSALDVGDIFAMASMCGADIKTVLVKDQDTEFAQLNLRFRKITTRRNLRNRNSYEIPLFQVQGNIRIFNDSHGFLGTQRILNHMVRFDVNIMTRKFQDYMSYTYGEMWTYLIREIYTPLFVWYQDTMPILDQVLLPHPKRLIYQKFVDDDITYNKIRSNIGTFESKYKDEFGKIGKVGRLYANGSHLPLVDYFSAEIIKFYFKEEWVSLGSRMITIGTTNCVIHGFCIYSDAVESDRSDALFNIVINIPNNTFYYIFFSDDGFLVMNLDGHVSFYETDISSCDSSNGFGIFSILYSISIKLGIDKMTKLLIEQCSRPTKVVNPSNPVEYVELQPETFFEYSGSKLTTVLNNIASVLIGSSIFDSIDQNIPLHTSIELGAAYVGYSVTQKFCKNLNSATFLKRAFNGVNSWLVYGPIFRSLGSMMVHRDTPDFYGVHKAKWVTMTHNDKFEFLLKSAVDGLVNEPGSVILDALRERTKSSCKNSGYVTVQDLVDRYGVPDHEWYKFASLIANVNIRDVVVCDALCKIYHVDYGMSLDQGQPDIGFFDIDQADFIF